MRAIDKQTLLTLISNYNWDPISREVVDHWMKIHGKNITIESEENEETDSSYTTRACDQKSGDDLGSLDVQSTDGAQECEGNTKQNNETNEG